MKGTLSIAGTAGPADLNRLGEALSAGTFFWLDLDLNDPGPDTEVPHLLADTLRLHPLAVEGATTFGQRARIDDFDGVVHAVTFGLADDAGTVAEVHCLVSAAYVVTLHEGDCPALGTVAERLTTHHAASSVAPQIAIFYVLLDTLIDSFFPVLASLDDRIDDLVGAILKNPTEQQLGDLFEIRKLIMGMRKVVAPQRDMISALNAGVVTIPGYSDAGRAYINSLYDHLIRISDMIDSYRDLTTSAMDTHLSMVSNRLNVVMKQLAVIATVFLPLSFLTGFFGQNFAWSINHLQTSGWDLLGWGVGTEVVAIAILFWVFRRRGWLGGNSAA